MNKKKIFAIVLFIILGLFALTFANPRTTKKDQPNNNNNTNDVIDNNNNNNNKDNKDDNIKRDDNKQDIKPVVKKENTKPEIKLNGGNVILRVDEEYVELGATATDLEDGDLTDRIVISSDIKNEKGIYYVFYTIEDSEGEVATISRKVEVVDTKDLEEDIDLGNEILDLTEDKIVSKDLQDLLDELEEAIENGNKDIDNHDSTQEVIDTDEDVIEEIIEKIKGLKFKVNFLIDNKIVAEFDKLFNESVSDEEIAGINTFKPGYTFSGWTGNYKNLMKNEDVNGTQVLNTYTLSSSIIFVVNGNSTTVDREPVKFDVENPVAFIEPVKMGYDCTGYKLADGTSVTSTVNMYEDTTITATCTARNDSKYTVVVNYEDEEPVNVPMDGITDTAIDVKALIEEYAKVGYTLDSVTPANATISGNNDTVITLNYVKEVYEVKFMNDGVQYGETQNVKFNGSAVAPSVNPTKDSTVDTVYTFTGWDKDFSVITEDTVVNAIYSDSTRKYTVTFVNYDGTVLASDDYDYGTIPSYIGTPVKEGNAQYSYTFAGWDKEVVAVTEDVTYNATFNETVNKYTVTFVNYNGTVLASDDYDYGTIPSYTGTPVKEGNAQYSYTFAGWDKEVVAVTEDVTYNATFNETVNKYTVKFVNFDGTELQKSDVEYGTIPRYNGKTPVKAATAQYTYTFAGWDNEVVAVTGNITYKATFKSTVNKYTVKFVNFDGTELQKSDVEYGTTPRYNGKTPVKAATAQYTYTFAGWDNEVVAVTGNVTYKATFKSTVNKYTVTFYVDGRVYGNAQSVEYGKGAIAPKNPSKTNYTFAGWDTDFSKVTGDLKVNAKFTANQTGIRAEVKPTMMLQFQKGKSYNIKDYINVYKVYADGSEELTSDYTVTGFSTSNVTKNEKLTIKQGKYTDESLTYSVINKEAFQTKFEVIYTDKAGYYYTNNSICKANCDEGHNISYKSLDYKPLEIVEHYDEIIKVTSVKVNYTNNISETLDLSDSVRWSDVDGWLNKEYYNPVYIASSTRTTKKNNKANKTRTADIMDSTYVISTVEIKYNREGYGDFVVYFEYNRDTNTFTAYDEAKVK